MQKENVSQKLLDTMRHWFDIAMIRAADRNLFTEMADLKDKYYEVEMYKSFISAQLSFEIKKYKPNKQEFIIVYNRATDSIDLYYKIKFKKDDKSGKIKGDIVLTDTSGNIPADISKPIDDVVSMLNGGILEVNEALANTLSRNYDINVMRDYYDRMYNFKNRIESLLSDKDNKVAFIYDQPITLAGNRIDRILYDNTHPSDSYDHNNFIGFDMNKMNFMISQVSPRYRIEDGNRVKIKEETETVLFINNRLRFSIGGGKFNYKTKFEEVYDQIAIITRIMNVVDELDSIKSYYANSVLINNGKENWKYFIKFYHEMRNVLIPFYRRRDNVYQDVPFTIDDTEGGKSFTVNELILNPEYFIKANINYHNLYNVNIIFDMRFETFDSKEKTARRVYLYKDDGTVIAQIIYDPNDTYRSEEAYKLYMNKDIDVSEIASILNDIPVMIDIAKQKSLEKDQLASLVYRYL